MIDVSDALRSIEFRYALYSVYFLQVSSNFFERDVRHCMSSWLKRSSGPWPDASMIAADADPVGGPVEDVGVVSAAAAAHF